MARRHANALSTKAAQIPMALRHHERRVATRSAQTLEANMSHDTTNHPAHQRHAAFTPACFALPSGTAPRKRTFHQGCANPNGTVTSRTSCRHTVCPHTRSFRSRHPPKLTCQSLQNERFVRDILQKSSGNTHQSTHVTQPCQAVSRFQPPKQHPLTRQSQWDSDIHLYNNSQPDDSLPATNLSASTRL